RELGTWPDIPEGKRNQYDLKQIKHHLGTFVDRFFRLSQFKRSCIPNAPKVGSGGSLSPRGDYRAPSDCDSSAWLSYVDLVPDSDT
ncbi:MAG: NAD(+) synthase, partial [Candidatus Binataceae bacterium]